MQTHVLEQPYLRVSQLLKQLESEIRGAGLWSEVAPDEKALQSALSFCCDTLHFQQWLQFVFLPKMHTLIKHKQSLPSNMLLLPMAEETLPVDNTHALKDVIGHLDAYFSQLSMHSVVDA
ncbi:YqcC family protein [Alteromonas sp. a30]|uniref:YqcC family protein n=1 Tax=Alteromonas sp. a30 TaxID=2730917 RepID=UPI00227E5E5B|nr:YqcC family protein [Alteromonas sp. a30]MCY7294331.1 YqcC family protein [Alteromonas sp. a30]